MAAAVLGFSRLLIFGEGFVIFLLSSIIEDDIAASDESSLVMDEGSSSSPRELEMSKDFSIDTPSLAEKTLFRFIFSAYVMTQILI
jgi:hypothetical protein